MCENDICRVVSVFNSSFPWGPCCHLLSTLQWSVSLYCIAIKIVIIIVNHYNVSSKSYSRHFEHCTRIDIGNNTLSDIKHACHCLHFICYKGHPGSLKNNSPQIGPRSVDIFTYRAFSLVIFGDISRILGIR